MPVQTMLPQTVAAGSAALTRKPCRNASCCRSKEVTPGPTVAVQFSASISMSLHPADVDDDALGENGADDASAISPDGEGQPELGRA